MTLKLNKANYYSSSGTIKLVILNVTLQFLQFLQFLSKVSFFLNSFKKYFIPVYRLRVW